MCVVLHACLFWMALSTSILALLSYFITILYFLFLAFFFLSTCLLFSSFLCYASVPLLLPLFSSHTHIQSTPSFPFSVLSPLFLHSSFLPKDKKEQGLHKLVERVEVRGRHTFDRRLLKFCRYEFNLYIHVGSSTQ